MGRAEADLVFDLLTGEPLFQTLHLATDQDRELGKDLVDLVEKDDLVLLLTIEILTGSGT